MVLEQKRPNVYKVNGVRGGHHRVMEERNCEGSTLQYTKTMTGKPEILRQGEPVSSNKYDSSCYRISPDEEMGVPQDVPLQTTPQTAASSSAFDAGNLSVKKMRKIITTHETLTVAPTTIYPTVGSSPGPGDSLTISPDSVQQLREHLESTQLRIQELEQQMQVIPALQKRISQLKEDKQMFAKQLQARANLSQMRSIGVGDIDVEEEAEYRIEKVVQKIVQEAAPPPRTEIGVGAYDVTEEYLSQAEAYHTIAEHVQKIKEKEIQLWIQEAENEIVRRRANLRSVGIGDQSVNDDGLSKIKEKETRTLLIGEDRSKHIKRDVGVQCKPSTRDVCIEYAQREVKPLTRTCGFNVEINDLIREIDTDINGDSDQKISNHQVTKHIVQRKILEAMHRGTLEELATAIGALVKRSVRSVATATKPSTSDFGTLTFTSSCERGVGDDTVNVQVRPEVTMRDSFTLAKPTTRSQPTWTDLILACDVATNTLGLEESTNVQMVQTERSPQSLARSKADGHSSESFYEESCALERSVDGAHRKSRTVTMSSTFNSGCSHEQRNVDSAIQRSKVKDDRVDTTYSSRIDRLVSPPDTRVELEVPLPQEVIYSTVQQRHCHSDIQESEKCEDLENHKAEMHMMLTGKPLTSLSVQVFPEAACNPLVSSSQPIIPTLCMGPHHSDKSFAGVVEHTFEGSLTGIKRKTQEPSSYFGSDVTSSKPHGHTKRMESYHGAAILYGTSLNEDAERNKFELHGNPLKSIYNINDLAYPAVEPAGTSNHSLPRDQASDTRSKPKEFQQQKESLSLQTTANSQKLECEEACTILQRSIENGGTLSSPSAEAALKIIRKEWLTVAFGDTANCGDIRRLISSFAAYSRQLLYLVVNSTDGNGNTALHDAVSRADYHVIQMLAETQAMICDTYNKDGLTAAMLVPLVKLSLGSGRDALRALFLCGGLSRLTQKTGETPLILACGRGQAAIAELLLECGSDVNEQSIDGTTALMAAVEHSHIETIDMLLQTKDVNLSLTDSDGLTAMDIAIDRCHKEVIKQLYAKQRSGSIKELQLGMRSSRSGRLRTPC